MALQDTTFKTVHVMDNEIIKASDFEFAFEQLVENVSKATQMLLESNQDFVINGKVIPSTGMNVNVSPIYGVCKSTGKPFGRTETTDETIGFEGSSSGRVDILEVKGDWDTYDNEQRAFNDPDTDAKTYQYVDTKKLMKPIYQIKKGVEGSGVAPDVDSGWVKLAEISIRAGATSIIDTDIHNITADVAGMANTDWTNEQDITYNIGYLSDVNARFRIQHNEDGTHKDDCINSDSLDIGIGSKQINGNILPVGGSVSIPDQTISSTDSILSVIVKAATLITSIYDKYLKYGDYSFKGEVNISNLIDSSNELVKPITISADGEGNAYIKIDGNTVLSIDSNGKLSTNGYTATSNNHLVTKVVTDAISLALTKLTTRVENIENTSDSTVYSNGVLSSGSDGRYNIDSTIIYAATTQNITLSGSQTIDGTSPSSGSIILVKDQTDAKENGIYQYSSNSTWTRLNGFLSPKALSQKIFNIVNGTLNGGRMYFLPKVNFIDEENFGTDNINFLQYFGSIKAIPDKVAYRDSNGHVKTANPSSADDAVNKGSLLNLIYPIGSLYWTGKAPDDNGDPNVLFGGTWEQIKDKFVLAAGDTYNNGDTGGSSTVTLTTAQMPSHNHGGGTGSVNLNHSHGIGDTNLTHSHDVPYFFRQYGVGNGGPKVINGESAYDTATLSVVEEWASTRSAIALGSHSHSCGGALGDHAHTIGAEGGNQAHENMPPYIVKFCWERIA